MTTARPVPDRRDYKMLIDGEWVGASDGGTFACVDPYTEESWGSVPKATEADVDRAVKAARRAFDDSGWPETTASHRASLLRKLAGLIEKHADRLVNQQVLENGKLATEMQPNILTVAGDCYFYAGLAETMHGMTTAAPFPNFATYTLRQPLGVVGAITPWNTPLGLLGWKMFPALAAGNTIVIKPSEVTPTSTLLLAELAMEAGFPKGVVNVVTGFGNPAGSALVAHPGVDKIAFTGSGATGHKIAAMAVGRGARVSLELGGKSPNIVFADADIDNAVNGIMAGIFAATGQTCVGGSRVLVEAPIYDQLSELLASRTRKIRAGDPFDPASQIAPVSSRAQLDKVLSYFDIARKDGLKLLAGGKRMDRKGFFVEPTVYGDVPNSCRLAREEVFGPVVALIRFEGEQEAIRIANDTAYGLAAGLWTNDLQRAHRIIGKLRAGSVWVNSYRMMGRTMPFGGVKQSGLGREMGADALNEYTEIKSVWIDTGNKIHFPAG